MTAAYNFRERYAPLIESGAKLCTIRKRRKNGYLPMPNDRLRLYVGMRTKGCRLLREVTVRDVVPVSIVINPFRKHDLTIVRVWISTHALTAEEILAFAKADGFVDVDDFAQFFYDTHGSALDAYLVRWWPEDHPNARP